VIESDYSYPEKHYNMIIALFYLSSQVEG
jgi:hypothetical protein